VGRWVAKWKSTIDIEQASRTFCAVRSARHNMVRMRATCNSTHRMKNITTISVFFYSSCTKKNADNNGKNLLKNSTHNLG